MSKEKVELQLKFTPNYKKYSILLNCYRVGGMKWNDVDGAIFHKIDLGKEDVLFALGVKQQIDDLEAKLAEKNELFIATKWKADDLEKQLAEEKNRSKKLNHEAQKYYEDAYCNGFQNKKAIAELEKVIEFAKTQDEFGFRKSGMEIFMFVDQQIKSLKGDADGSTN